MRIDTHTTLGNRKKQCVAITFQGSDDLSDSQWISRMVDFCHYYGEYLEGKGTEWVSQKWADYYEKIASAKESFKPEHGVVVEL